MKYDESIKVYSDQLATLDFAKQKGRAEGRAEEKAAIARNLKALGLTTAQIAEATGLSEEEVRNIEEERTK